MMAGTISIVYHQVVEMRGMHASRIGKRDSNGMPNVAVTGESVWDKTSGCELRSARGGPDDQSGRVTIEAALCRSSGCKLKAWGKVAPDG